jgi:hypothetical protein
MRRLSDEDVKALYKLRDMVARLRTEELYVFMYLWDNISVGEIVFERDLSRIYRVRKPILVAIEMREKGLVERGEGCYNLPRWIRRLRMKIGRFDELKKILDSLP